MSTLGFQISKTIASQVPKMNAKVVSNRLFSSHHAVQRLRDVFEEYRQANFSQCIRSRYQKEMIKAADIGQNGYMTMDDIQKLLRNIGAEGSISSEELEIVLVEAGAEGQRKVLPIEKMKQLL